MTPWIIGNWKLNPVTQTQARQLTLSIIAQQQGLTQCQLMVAPSSVHLVTVQNAITTQSTDDANSSIELNAHPSLMIAAQDVCAYTATTGAFTGDHSAEQLSDIGAKWVIIGHSERRQYYNEGNTLLFKKMANSVQKGLGVILCIGESEAQYEVGQTHDILSQQLTLVDELWNSVTNINVTTQMQEDNLATSAEASKVNKLSTQLIIAYEPVWAIGTGKIPSVAEVTQVHSNIRAYLKNIDSSLQTVPIIYGGSVKPDNASDFALSPVIDGVLVGGAALEADSFINIALAFDATKLKD